MQRISEPEGSGGRASTSSVANPDAPPPRVLRILVIGFGNPGRRDDGLGPALAARVAALNLPSVTVETDYQLAIEHAELVARHDVVIFADAARDVSAGAAYYLRPLPAASDQSGFSHHLSPPAVLHLAAHCFGAHPRAWLLGIRPSDLASFAEGLTPAADQNLTAAFAALVDRLASWQRDPAG